MSRLASKVGFFDDRRTGNLLALGSFALFLLGMAAGNSLDAGPLAALLLVAAICLGAAALVVFLRVAPAEAERAAARQAAAEEAALSQPTIVRTYKGHQQADAVTAFGREAAHLAERGYVPTAQSWAQGQWGCGGFLVALLLCIFLIGILIFIYMLLVKPEGTLTVTYIRREAVPAPTPPVLSQGPPADETASLKARLAQLDDAHCDGLISDQDHAAKRALILERF